MSDTAELRALLDELARKEGMLVGETAKARIYRDRIGGTVVWIPHDAERLELTLIQVRMADEARADALHSALAEAIGKPVEDIPSHQLGMSAAEALRCWTTLEHEFLPAYLQAHRDVQAGHSFFRGPPTLS